MANKPRARRGQRKSSGRGRKVVPLNTVQKTQVKAIVHGEAETKRAVWYSQFDTGSVQRTTPFLGTLANSGWQTKNNTITNNFADILRLIPEVVQGTDKFERIGVRIKPSSLVVKGTCRVNAQTIGTTGTPNNFKVYIYVLQHVAIKEYNNLYSYNNFAQLLDAGNGSTIEFLGNPSDAHCPVAKQNYRVLARKEIILRYGGSFVLQGQSQQQSVTMVSTPANAHTWYADYTFNLTKHLPATLTYPESIQSGSANLQGDPTNSSIFMCMGYVDWRNPGNAIANFDQAEVSQTPVETQLQNTYVSHMTYKDV